MARSGAGIGESGLLSRLDDAVSRGREHLLGLQSQAGWWKADLQSNVTMDAEDILLREFLGIREAEGTALSAAWIRAQQQPHGGWATFADGPGDLSTTIEAYWALRIAGDTPDDAHMRRARTFVRRNGGIERARVFTRVWLAVFGHWPWQRVPTLLPEIMLLPDRAPFAIYGFGCWARQTIVPLSVVMAYRPVRPQTFALDELCVGGSPDSGPRGVTRRTFDVLDRVLRVYAKAPIGSLPRAALARAERWIVRRQEADGSWGGIQPPWVYSLMALSLLEYPLDHPVMTRGIQGLERFFVYDREHDPPTRWLEACQSPVWDTALAITALRDAGVRDDDVRLDAAARWLLSQQVARRGDWSVARPQLEPGGWAFEFANVNYPDVDDTAEVVLALRGLRPAEGRSPDDALRRAVRWVEGMQSQDGGWGAFDADNDSSIVNLIPFLDFGEVTDPPSADVTAHALEMLAATPEADVSRMRAARAWLIARQQDDGSWFGRWGVNHIYGTGAVVPALIAAGVNADDPVITRATGWLERHQNADGGWGEDPRSYSDPAWIGHGPSTASQTAWALLALHAAGTVTEPLLRGLDYLTRTQREDGAWDEPAYTGTGFPGDFYINYSQYRNSFPLTALGRCQRMLTTRRPVAYREHAGQHAAALAPGHDAQRRDQPSRT